MTEIINLRQQRKAKARTDKEKQAAANRAKFGQTKQEKLKAKHEKTQAKKHIDGHKRSADEEE